MLHLHPARLIVGSLAVSAVVWSWYVGFTDAKATDLDRVFVGVPNQLTLPPCIPRTTPCLDGCEQSNGANTALDDQRVDHERAHVEEGEPQTCTKVEPPPSQKKESINPENSLEGQTSTSQQRER